MFQVFLFGYFYFFSSTTFFQANFGPVNKKICQGPCFHKLSTPQDTCYEAHLPCTASHQNIWTELLAILRTKVQDMYIIVTSHPAPKHTSQPSSIIFKLTTGLKSSLMMFLNLPPRHLVWAMSSTTRHNPSVLKWIQCSPEAVKWMQDSKLSQPGKRSA